LKSAYKKYLRERRKVNQWLRLLSHDQYERNEFEEGSIPNVLPPDLSVALKITDKI
jgi:hypothetical protein